MNEEEDILKRFLEEQTPSTSTQKQAVYKYDNLQDDIEEELQLSKLVNEALENEKRQKYESFPMSFQEAFEKSIERKDGVCLEKAYEAEER